jgi:hypothetical protein
MAGWRTDGTQDFRLPTLTKARELRADALSLEKTRISVERPCPNVSSRSFNLSGTVRKFNSMPVFFEYQISETPVAFFTSVKIQEK